MSKSSVSAKTTPDSDDVDPETGMWHSSTAAVGFRSIWDME